MDDGTLPKVLPRQDSEATGAGELKRSVLRRRIFKSAAALFLIAAALLVRAWFPMLWGDPHIVNFIVAAIPTILSILFAFIVDKDLERHSRFAWRLSIVAAGMLYSLFLWHQQDLADQTNSRQTAKAITSAISRANAHSDQMFGGMQRQVTGLGTILDQTQQALQSQIGKTEIDLTSSIGKVGKPGPPETARLVATLWDVNASGTHPVTEQTLTPGSDGIYSVSFSIMNVSDVAAEGVDLWVQVCSECSFAKESPPFLKNSGISESTRYRTIQSLNPGTNLEKQTIFVKYDHAGPSRGFQLECHYSCRNCGKMQPPQALTIYAPLSSPQFFYGRPPQFARPPG